MKKPNSRYILWSVVILFAVICLWTVGTLQEKTYPKETPPIAEPTSEPLPFYPCEGEKCI